MTLKELKNLVHEYLDGIWLLSNKKSTSRTNMYKWLSIQMGLSESRTHVRFFNKEKCLKAIKILKPKYIQLYGHDIRTTI